MIKPNFQWRLFFGLGNILGYESKQRHKLTPKELEEKKRREIINLSDKLHNDDRHEETCKILARYNDTGDVEVLWRIARAKYLLWESTRRNKRRLITEGYNAVCIALDIDAHHAASHKWAAVLLDEKSSLDGLRNRIQALSKVKAHLMKANKYDAFDITPLYLLGVWCYEVADMSFLKRRIAATFYASPPTSSYEEALTYFKLAEELKPNFYSRNQLMLAKTYLRLGFLDRAKFFLNKALENPPHMDVDLKTHAEARKLLEDPILVKSHSRVSSS